MRKELSTSLIKPIKYLFFYTTFPKCRLTLSAPILAPKISPNHPSVFA